MKNRPGGSIYAGMAIYDAMQMIKAPVSTVAVGLTASMGTALLCAGAAGQRYALPHATIHLHPAGGGAQGYTEDVRIAYREQERLQTQLFHLIGRHTGHTWQQIESDFRRDRFLNAVEASSDLLAPGSGAVRQPGKRRQLGRQFWPESGAGRRLPLSDRL